MNLRWLWLNHVPAGIELAPEERGELNRQVHQLRKNPAIDPAARRRYRREAFMLVAPLVILFCIWTIWLSPNNLTGWWKTVVGCGSIFIYNIILWLFIAFAYYRTNAPYVRRALNRIGHPVCVTCGYPLLGLDETSPCPECGSARWKDDLKPQENTPASSPESTA